MSYIGNQPSQVAFVTDTFSGNASTTAFTMSVAPANTASVLVAITGVVQDPSTYSVNGTTLTFSAAPPNGTGNISVRYLGIPASGVTTTAYRTVTEFTATAGQTIFTPPSYTVGFINVHQNGSLLGSADYTATNGTTVVLTAAAAVNDLITVESFLVSSVLNALPLAGGTVSGNTIFQSTVAAGGGTVLGGATNPVVAMSKGANNYIQSYIINNTNGSSSSADFVAYPSNGTDAHGWIDAGITSPSYADSTYTVTGPNEAYLFGSAPSGSGTTGNLVYATDNTGTQNAHQFYVGGFTQAKNAYKFAIESTGAHGQLVSGTAQASTSGTSIDFTGIPSWVKRITVMMVGISTNGTNKFLIQLGTAGGVVATGYLGTMYNPNSFFGFSTGFQLGGGVAAGNYSGQSIICLQNASTNTWTETSNLMRNDAADGAFGGGSIALSGALTTVRITTVGSTDTFDAGSINILYEG